MTTIKRKIIRQGAGGSTISLPINWVREQQLEQGDELYLTQMNDSLHVAPVVKRAKKTARIVLTQDEPVFIHSLIDVHYRVGYDRLEILIQNEKQKTALKEILQAMYTGFPIIEEKENIIIAEQASEEPERTEKERLRKMFLFVKDSFLHVQERLQEKKKIDSSYLQQNIHAFRKQDNAFRRQVANRTSTAKDFGGVLWGASNYLLLLQHSLFHLGQETSKQQFSQTVLDFFGEVAGVFDDVYTSFFKKKERNMRINDEQAIDLLYKQILPALQEYKGEDAVALYYLGEQARLIHTLITPLRSILICNDQIGMFT